MYCSDVSGAFDRVDVDRLRQKLTAKGLHHQWVYVLLSWLRQRAAQVVVSGQYSDKLALNNMVYQGTVWGPSLWNLFFEDARRALNSGGFTEAVYADDLNAFKAFAQTTPNEQLLGEAKTAKRNSTAGAKLTG